MKRKRGARGDGRGVNFAHEGSERREERREQVGGGGKGEEGEKGVETKEWVVLYSHEGSEHPYPNLASTQGPEPPKNTKKKFRVLALPGP